MFESPFRGLGEEEKSIPAGSVPPVEHYFLLVIGIDMYQPGFNPLNNAVSDAKKVTEKLTSKYRFEADKVYTLYNEEATAENIITKVAEIYQQTGPNDAVLIYFAGHGIYGKSRQEYYLIACDSKQLHIQNQSYFSLVPLSLLYNNFQGYTADPKCRDLLIVLDACYSGGSVEGYGGSQHSELFSRHLLTSCLKGQQADDGIKGRGSAFANAFVDALEANDRNFYSFAAMAPVFGSKFDSSDIDHKLQEGQTIAFDRIPNMQTGRGSFIFEKMDKARPDLLHLRDSLIDKLDFTDQRADIEDYFKTEKSQLNIITTQGHSFDVQKLLAKVIFRDLRINYSVDFASGYCYARERINLDMDPASDIWSQLYKQVKGIATREDKDIIFQWFFDKLLSDEMAMHAKRHVILWITLRLAAPGVFKAIERFCLEFSGLFVKAFDALPREEKAKRGKMFIVIADERENPADSHRELLKSIVGHAQYNFIPTRKIKDINQNHTTKWLNSFAGDNVSEKILELKKAEIYEQCIGVQDLRYEDFVVKICNHCVYSSGEIEVLHAHLYDFNNNLLF